MTMERKLIRRGGIRSAGYDADRRLLEVEFDGGTTLQYSGVGAEIARRLLASAAPASYYRDNIEEEFPSKRVAAPGSASTDPARPGGPDPSDLFTDGPLPPRSED